MTEATPRPGGRFAFDVALTGGSRVVIAAAGLLQSVLIAREFGPDGRGVLVAVLALAMLLAQLGTLGLSTANPFFAATEPERRGRVLGNAIWLSLGIGALLAGVGVLIRLIAPDAVQGTSAVELGLALGSVPASLFALLVQNILLTEKRVVAYNAAGAGLALVPAAALGLLFLLRDASVTQALAVIAASQWTAAATYLKLLGRPRSRGFDTQLARRMLAYALRVYAATVLAYLVIRIDVLLVNAYVGNRGTGLYTVAVAIVDAAYLIPTAIGFNLFARVARGSDWRATVAVFRGTALLMLGVIGISLLLARPFIEGVYGRDFAAAVELYYWLAPGAYALGLTSVLSHHFAGRGFPKELVWIWVGGLVLNVALNVTLLPSEGVYIASLSASATYLLVLSLHMWLFMRATRSRSLISPTPSLRVS